MAEKSRPRRANLERELRFLSDIGADFIFIPQTPRRRENPAAAAKVLQKLEKKILSCTVCQLAAGRTKAVPGEGNAGAELMFVGEGPGADEDIQGRPFVGRAGQLLTKIIAAMGFNRPEVYITNVVKCRPPENRTPARGEVEACRPYLDAQIEAIAPKVIVSLGKAATDFFHPSTIGMTKRRGQFIEYGRVLVMPTFHPSYILRNEGNKEIKKLVWQDMKQVMAVLGKK